MKLIIGIHANISELSHKLSRFGVLPTQKYQSTSLQAMCPIV